MLPKILGRPISCDRSITFSHVARIMSASVRENILFSYEYDETFYNLVIEGDVLP